MVPFKKKGGVRDGPEGSMLVLPFTIKFTCWEKGFPGIFFPPYYLRADVAVQMGRYEANLISNPGCR